MTTNVGEVNAQLASLDARTGSAPVGGSSARSSVSFASPTANISHQQAKHILLKRKVNEMATMLNPNQVCMNLASFYLEADLEVWCGPHLSTGAFGSFVDPLVAYQMLLRSEQVGTVDTWMKTLELVRRLGLHGLREGMALKSMATTIPTIFGGVGTSEAPPPKLKSYSDWNNGSSSNVKTCIEDGLLTLYSEISQAIKRDLDDPEARLLAHECLTQTTNFMTKEQEFMEKTYRDFMGHGYSAKQAWVLSATLEASVLTYVTNGRAGA